MIPASTVQGVVTVALGCAGYGAAVLGALQCRVQRAEFAVFGLAAGGGVMAVGGWLLARFDVLKRGPVSALAVLGVAAGLYWGRRITWERGRHHAGPWITALLLAALAGWMIPDAWQPPLGNEAWLWKVAAVFGGAPVAAWLHCGCLALLAGAAWLALSERCGEWAAATAALLAAGCPAALMYAARGESELLMAGAGMAAAAAILKGRELWWLAPLMSLAAAGSTMTADREWNGPLFAFLPWVAAPAASLLWGWLVRRQRMAALALAGFQLVTAPLPLEPEAGAREKARRESRADAEMVYALTDSRAVIVSELPMTRAQSGRSMAPVVNLDVLGAAVLPGLRPDHEQRSKAPSSPNGRYVVTSPERITEVRFYWRGQEVPRRSAWRMRVREGEGRAADLFDNDLVTGCRCTVEIDFGGPVQIDEMRTRGPVGEPAALPQGLRRAAVEELKRRGVTHILARAASPLGADLATHAEYWGVSRKGERPDAVLYALE